MRALAIVGEGTLPADVGAATLDRFELEGRIVPAGFIQVEPPDFDPASGGDSRRILLRTEAFSCNYRDGALLLAAYDAAGAGDFYVVGSEAAGVVEEVGAEVTCVRPGERVMFDCAYGVEAEEPWGVPTNHASRAYQVLPSCKVYPVPPEMSTAEAAAFTIGGQTASAMVRRADVGPGDAVLVTAARSNTSLFLISILAARGCDVSVLTTSSGLEERLLERGANRVFAVPRVIAAPEDAEALSAFARERTGFAAVFDPFADVHALLVLPLLAMGGRIVTCGARRGAARAPRPGEPERRRLQDALSPLIRKQASIIGNCLGTTADLRAACELWAEGRLPVPIDSVTDDSDERAASAFLRRTMTDPDRFGKVVHRYHGC